MEHQSFSGLEEGRGDWINIQPVVRSTFLKMAETLSAQAERLRQQEEASCELQMRLRTKERELEILERTVVGKLDDQAVQDVVQRKISAALQERLQEHVKLVQHVEETFSLLDIRLRSREEQLRSLETSLEERVDAATVQRLLSKKLRDVLPRLDRVERDVVTLDAGKVNAEELEEAAVRLKEELKVQLELHTVREVHQSKQEMQRRLQELEEQISGKADQHGVARLLDAKVDSQDLQDQLRRVQSQISQEVSQQGHALQESAVHIVKVEEDLRDLRREVEKKADSYQMHEQLSIRDADVASLQAKVETMADWEHVQLQLRKKVDLDAMRDHTSQFATHHDMESTLRQMLEESTSQLGDQVQTLQHRVDDLDTSKADRDFVLQELLNTKQGAQDEVSQFSKPLQLWYLQRQNQVKRHTKRHGSSQLGAGYVDSSSSGAGLSIMHVSELQDDPSSIRKRPFRRALFNKDGPSGDGPDVDSVSISEALGALFHCIEEMDDVSSRSLAAEQKLEDFSESVSSKLHTLQGIADGLESDMLRRVTMEDLHKVEQSLLTMEEGWRKDARNIQSELKRLHNFEEVEELSTRLSKVVDDLRERMRSSETELSTLSHGNSSLSNRIAELADQVHDIHQNAVVRSELQKLQERVQECRDEVSRGHPHLHELRDFQHRCEESVGNLNARMKGLTAELEKRPLFVDVQSALEKKMESRLVHDALEQLEQFIMEELEKKCSVFEAMELKKTTDSLCEEMHSAKLTLRSLSSDGRLDDILRQVDDIHRRKADKDAVDAILESWKQRFVDRSTLSAELHPILESLHQGRAEADHSLERKLMEVESNIHKLAHSVETVSLSLTKEVKRLSKEKADLHDIQEEMKGKVARDALDARLMQLVSHEELSHWVEQIHQHFRQQLVALPEWNLLERLEAQAKQWATRVFVEETVDRRVNNLQRSFEPLLAGVQTLRRAASPMRVTTGPSSVPSTAGEEDDAPRGGGARAQSAIATLRSYRGTLSEESHVGTLMSTSLGTPHEPSSAAQVPRPGVRG